jgi:hypothetical protein
MRIFPKVVSPKEVWEYDVRTLTDPSNIVNSVWNAASRTLTQTKFPFWSAIISLSQGTVSVPAGSTVYVAIQPPAGETWLVWLNLYWVGVSGSPMHLWLYDYDGSTMRAHTGIGQEPTGSPGYGNYTNPLGLGALMILLSTLYARIGYHNGTSATTYSGYYGYSGFKLSQPLWTPRRLIDSSRPWKRPTTLTLPDPIKPLQKYACEMLGLDLTKPEEYTFGVILEEDTPLAVDPETGFPVERLTVVAKADDLASIISGIKAGKIDPVASGYKKYLEKWASEGVKL